MASLTEYDLVERPAMELLAELGWEVVDAMDETIGSDGTFGRQTRSEVFLARRLSEALSRINPDIPTEGIVQAVDEITRDRSAMHYGRANAEIHHLLRDGVVVQVRADDGTLTPERLSVIDWNNPENNDFLIASQLWVHSDLHKRRADLIGFVNGIPLVFMEFKAPHHSVKEAYDKNLTDYRDTVPHLFIPNGFLLLSNGSDTRVGTITASWDYFSEWKKINSEGEEGIVSLETVLRGMCTKERLLDILENFIAFQDAPGGFIKLLARNHQYLGVNNAIARLGELRNGPPDERGKLGVFWHTQGSGKTMSMLFFSQKVLRKMPGNWSFVIVTDREDLDDQAHREFLRAGVVSDEHVQATSASHLRELLGEDHRYVFTLIHKFRTEKGEAHPVLSERDDVVVITDEAHRTQYDTLALNMRNALPNASFLGFTGTPLIAGEERTREVFGDYVSVYNFADSAADRATVPLYYENRIPTINITNPNFDDDLTRIVEQADLDEAEERLLARKLGQQYELITREDRLDTVAEDIVSHFLGRGFPGKAMVVSIDKATAVRTYEKVQHHWTQRIAETAKRLEDPSLTTDEVDLVEKELAFLRGTDMAVVISQSQNEIAEMEARGLDIRPHRRRIVEEDLEGRFKDAQDPLRIAFVCSMWTTGFDVPSLSTVYLDKPLKNHTLMQTITRANRVFPEKNSGLIVAYVDVFHDLHKALAIYAQGSGGGELPVAEKTALVIALRKRVHEMCEYALTQGVDLPAIADLSGFQFVEAARQAVEKLMTSDDAKAKFLAHSSLVNRIFKAVLPDAKANEFSRIRAVAKHIADSIISHGERPDISGVMQQIGGLLDESIAAEDYVIPPGDAKAIFDLGSVDWEKIRKTYEAGRKRSAAERMRALLAARISAAAQRNPTRIDLVERFQTLVDSYNQGSMNVEEFFKALEELAASLTDEEARAVSEHLTEEQLAIFDLLMRPSPELTDKEIAQVKRIADELLSVLRQEKFVLDWRKEQATRAAVRVTVETVLDQLPEKFTKPIYEAKCNVVYEHVFESYWDDGRSVYDVAA